MCGITGVVNLDGKAIDRKYIKKMIKVIKYRGPDDEGYFIEKNIGLGHCRLSIIDLSAGGHQPMETEDKGFCITYNGEIYNYLEIKEELKKLGHSFKSDTDTEVILHSFKEWEENCLNKFNGMWAFAIWDVKKKELFCSRDRFGVKPFYYYFDGKIFAFASEIKALLELGVKREPNEVLIYDFLKFEILDHTNETFFRKINKLPPACWLKIKASGGMIIRKYWDFEVSDEIENQVSDPKYAEDFRELFIDAVRLRLRSDVPVGTCLSGGLDSSSIACGVNKLLKGKNIQSIGEIQKTFSACFEDKKIDEREYIENVILNTDAEKNYIFPSSNGFLEDVYNVIWHQEEPFVGTSIYAQWMVMKTAKKKIKALLDGQGGDENLCGYTKYPIFYLRKLWDNRKYFPFLNEFARFLLSPDILKSLNIRKGLKYFGLGNKILKWEKIFDDKFFKKFKERKLNFSYQKNMGNRIKDDITTWSLPALLRYEDKNSMAHSIEARLPFLDYRLVEKMALMPLNQKMRNGWTKFVLRNAMKGILPEKVRLRKSKLGFSTPEDDWIRKDLFKEIKSTIQNSYFLQNYINKKELLYMFERFCSNQTFLSGSLFFRFYILELWARKFIINYDHQK